MLRLAAAIAAAKRAPRRVGRGWEREIEWVFGGWAAEGLACRIAGELMIARLCGLLSAFAYRGRVRIRARAR